MVNFMVLQISPITAKPSITWEPLPANYIFPDDPVENIQQPSLAAALTDALGAAGLIQSQMLMGTNLGLVATVNKKIVVKAPDWFYIPQVNPVAEGVIRRSYTPNNEGSAVAIVMEFLSDSEGGELSIRSTPPYGKLHYSHPNGQNRNPNGQNRNPNGQNRNPNGQNRNPNGQNRNPNGRQN
jgi:hypothetical protein